MPGKIGKYEIRLQLGRGGMGVVYEGFDPIIGRRVAIKTLRTDAVEPEDLPEFLARFQREAQSAGRLSHPHIVTIHEYGEQDGMPYIVMEYIQGHDLGVDLKRGVRFRLEDVVRMMTQLLGALGHAHEAGVVHRDIKPQNIILLEDGSLKVVDFGIARIEESEAFTKTGAMIGTPAYMSPEQVLGQHVTAKSDLFSVGTLLYQLLTGDRPFGGDEWSIKQKVLKQDPMPPSDLNPTLGAPWNAVVARAMAKKPEARYDSARQMLEAIRAAGEAEQRAAAEERRKRIEAEEHANREAAARSREAAQRREQAERQAALNAAREKAADESAAREALRRESERAAKLEVEAKARREAAEATVASPAASPKGRGAVIASGIVVAVVALGTFLYMRTGADDEARKLEAARIATEVKLKEESEKRAKAEALAREEAEKRSKLEAESRAQAEQAAKAKAEEEAKKATEEKTKALALKKEEEDRKKAEAVAKKEAEAKALALAEAQRKADEQAKREAEEKARAEAARKAEEVKKLAARKPGEVFRDCPDCPRMVVIPASEFTMGSPASEAGRDANEGPQRRVRISAPFALGRNEITVAEFRRFADDAGYKTEAERNVRAQGCRAWDKSDGKWEFRAGRSWLSPGFAQGGAEPVVCISWNDAKAYVEWLSKRTGQKYRLPTEAEWEYAGRAGSSAARFWGDDPDMACQFANVADTTSHEGHSWGTKHNCNDGHWFPAPVGTYKPNRFGLYDMLGNVWEWTEDCYNASYNGAPADGSAWLAGNCSLRVDRGGAWNGGPRGVRSAVRNRSAAGYRVSLLAFRLARTLE